MTTVLIDKMGFSIFYLFAKDPGFMTLTLHVALATTAL